MSFILAIHKAFRTAAFETPVRAAAPVSEYLIVQRPNAETVTVSDAGRALKDKPDGAPDTLSANNTQVGTLIRQDQDAETETFILNRFCRGALFCPKAKKSFLLMVSSYLAAKMAAPRRLSLDAMYMHAKSRADVL